MVKLHHCVVKKFIFQAWMNYYNPPYQCAVKAISSLGVRSRWILVSTKCGWKGEQNFWKTVGVIYGQPKSSLQLISGSWSLLLVFCYGVYHLSNSTTPPLAALHISTLTFKTWLIFSRSGLVYTVSKFYDSALGNETGFLSLSLLSSSLIYTTYRFFNPTAKLYMPSTLNIDLILWHTQLIVCAEKVKSWFKS